MLDSFLKNEVEPWYLGLQNEDLGAQARSNYTYKALRRARNTIVVGHLVTPKTDPGDYVVEPNADWVLQAGEEIDLKPGVHIKAGAKAHLQIFYEQCTEKADLPANSSSPTTKATTTKDEENGDSDITMEKRDISEEAMTVFPNPTTGTFTIKANNVMKVVTLYRINGQLIDKIENVNNREYHYNKPLERGTYLLIVEDINSEMFHKKLMVL